MERPQYIEHTYENLVDKHIYITKSRKIENDTHHDLIEVIYLRARVLEANKDTNIFQIEYTGNDNILFDGTIEEVTDDDCIFKNDQIVVEEISGKLNKKLGMWETLK